MKNSGIEWIGEIPDEWKLIKIGSIFQCRNEKVNDTDYPPLSVSKGGIVPQMESVAKTDANDNRKLVLTNDFVINSRSDRKQSCGYSALSGSVSLINTVLYAINDKIILPQYTDYLMKNYGFAEEFYRWGHGIVADLWTTRWQEMKSIVLPIPSIEAQYKIIKRLQIELGAVDKLIENQRTQIEKLKEYKQSVITEAVTKGLDPSVPLKDSGVDLIGNIPENWNVTRIKYVCIFNHTTNSHIEKDEMVGYVPMECVKNGYMESREISINEITSGLTCFTDGDIIMAKVTPCFENGNIAIANNLTNGIGYGSSELFVFRPTKIYSKFLFYFLRNNLFMEYAKATMTGTGGLKRVSPNFIKSLKFACPCVEEQQQIADYLDKKCAEIDKLIAIKQQKIETLAEYKKSLIYEYVTGKKQVGYSVRKYNLV